MSNRSHRTLLILCIPVLVLVGCSAAITVGSSGDPSAVASAEPSSGGGRGLDYDYGSSASPDAGASPTEDASAPSDDALPIGIGTGAVGTFLTGPDGRTLYFFTVDAAESSACSGSCADAWPPLTVSADVVVVPASGVTGAFTTFSRDDGSTQVAYNGRPLYWFGGDTAPGDTNGQGINDVWFVAQP